MTNHNPETGIAYGYISANSIHPDVLHTLLYEVGINVSEIEAYNEELAAAKRSHEADEDQAECENPDHDRTEFDPDDFEPSEYQIDDPIIEGTYQGVNYRTSYMQSMNLWIFHSPFTTDKARRASPCVPGAGILDTLDGSTTCYDVPESWRAECL